MQRRCHGMCKRAAAVLPSLLLVIWIASAWWWWGGPLWSTRVSVVWRAGRVDLMVNESGIPIHSPGWRRVERHNFPFGWWFRVARPPTGRGFSDVRLEVPIWSLALLSAAPWAWLSRRRAAAQHSGLCTKCGYDLRGADHKVCPECGSELD